MKAKQFRGVVAEIKPASCIIITPDGGFEEVRRPGGEVRPGDEILALSVAGPSRMPYWLKPLLAAAMIFIAVFAGYGYSGRFQPQPVAYVTLDINPSIELGIDNDNRIVSCQGLNKSGDRLLHKLNIKKQYLYQGISSIVGEAINQGYIREDQDNFVLSTLVCSGGEHADSGITASQLTGRTEKIEMAIKEPVAAKGIAARVAVEEVKPEFRRKALAEGISPGKLLLRERAEGNKIRVEVDELKDKSIRSLEKNKHIKLEQLFPGVHGQRAGKKADDKKIQRPAHGVWEKNIEQPPGQEKKRRDQDRRAPGRTAGKNDNKQDKPGTKPVAQDKKRSGSQDHDSKSPGNAKKNSEDHRSGRDQSHGR